MVPQRQQHESAPSERRCVTERRTRTLHALFYGNLYPRRRGPRRNGDASLVAVDWHDARWLAVAMLILMLSCADAMLTLMLLQWGAYEANPVMAPLVHGSGVAFAVVKLGLTGTGVVVLTALARMRAFGRLPIGIVLYGVLIAYGALIAYEVWMLGRLTAAG
ncbi:MAG TPA: DUF5658 family protein [Steroidobacteraceae bacterium]|nr:DUF5658 family protein [Steroidobacteraceae bacterium]